MGWLDIALDTDAATQAAITVNKIENAFDEDAQVDVLESLAGTLKDALSNLRTAAEELTGRSDYPQKIIAGGMILLEMRLQESLITSEHFLNQVDKDYADSAIQLIRGQGNRLITQLSPPDQDEVRDMVLNARRMADYGHFIDHFKDGDELLSAADVVDVLGWRNSLGGLLVLWIGFILILIGLATIPIIMLTNDQVMSAYIGFTFLVVIAGVGFIFTSRWIKAKEFKEAMATIDEIGDGIDIDRFEAIYRELNGNKNRAIGFQKSAQLVVEKFFLGLPMPNLREYLLEPEGVKLDEEEIPDLPPEYTPAFNPSRRTREITDQQASRSTPRRGRSDTTKVRPSIQPPQSTTTPRFCGQCGAKTPPGAAFCPNCGNSLH